MMKTFACLALMVGGFLAAEAHAQACSPPSEPDPTVTKAELLAKELAKNVGIPLQLSVYGDTTPEIVRSTVIVTVRSGQTVIDGSLEPLLTPEKPLYRWRAAAGDTPVGQLTVSIEVKREATANTAPITETVTILDRLAVAKPTPATISVTRVVSPDGNAPAIVCKRTHGFGECGNGSYEENVATRWVGLPNVRATLAPADTPDAPLVQIATEMFGRDKNGTQGKVQKSGSAGIVPGQPPIAAYAQLERGFDEYCTTTTTTILGVPEASVATSCGSPKVDLSVTNDEAVSNIREETSHCDSTSYPPGTSEDDPTGQGDGGCQVGPRSNSSSLSTLGLAFAVSLIVTARKRGQGAASRCSS